MPVVRVTGVLPQLRTLKLEGALMSYHSFFRKGSNLCREGKGSGQTAETASRASAARVRRFGGRRAGAFTHTFFPFPFLPLDRRLFLPTAICQAEETQR